MRRESVILSRDRELDRARSRASAPAGRTIAFANGCFDLLHVGHVRYLQGAAAEADRLIVAVNDDRSVGGAEGAGPADPAGRRPRRARRRAARRRLRGGLRRSDRRAAAAAAASRTCTARAPTTRSSRCPERAVVAGYGGRTAIVGDPKDHATRESAARRHPRARRREARVLIVRLGALGDIVHAIPVAAALRRAFPDARIDWLVSAQAPRDPGSRARSIDRRLVVNDRGGRPGGASLLGGGPRAARGAQLRRRDRSAGAAQVGAASRGVGRAAGDRLRLALSRASRWRGCSTPTCTIPGGGGIYAPRETRHVVADQPRPAGSRSASRRPRRSFRSSASTSARPRAMAASRPAAATRCSIPARRGRTSAGRRRGWPPSRRRCASGTA